MHCEPQEGLAGAGNQAEDERLFVPECLPNTDYDGGNTLRLVAFTLREGPSGPELYTAVKNQSDLPICVAGISTDFFNQSDELVASWSSNLQSGRLYQIYNGTGPVLACIAPGQIAMSAAAALPEGIVIEELAYLKHRFPAFPRDDAVPLEPPAISGLELLEREDGIAYSGTLTNTSSIAVTNPSVTVFAVNAVGRPLGAATASEEVEVGAGEAWTFETNAIAQSGSEQVIYATVAFPE